MVSHVGRDRPWAEWVARQLRHAGVEVGLRTWNWLGGQSLASVTIDALVDADRVLALFSTAALDADQYIGGRWSVTAPSGGFPGRVVPVRIEPVSLPPGWAALPALTLYPLAPTAARDQLVAAVSGARPTTASGAESGAAPGGEPPAGAPVDPLPGLLPPVCGLPARDGAFVGRDAPLVTLHDRLRSDGRVVVEGRYGMGGVGKSRLVLEYAYRFAAEYDAVWWLTAERIAPLGEQLARLAVRLGLAEADTDVGAAVTRARSYLRAHRRWLLVFDNAESAEELAPWLPGGDGHTVITSRVPGWGGVAASVEVDLLSRAESIVLLRRRHSGLAVREAGRLAAVLGDLPLALVQAAGFLVETGTPTPDYFTGLAEHVARSLDEHRSVNYPHTLAGAIATTTSWLAGHDPGVLAVARVCALVAHPPVATALLAGGEPLGDDPAHPLAGFDRVVDNPAELRRALGRLCRLGLVTGDDRRVGMHQLTGAILWDQLGSEQRKGIRAHVDALVAAAAPGDQVDVRVWTRWGDLLPHLLAVDPAHSESPPLRAAATAAVRYLLARGDIRGGRDLAEHLYRCWRQRLGADHDDVLVAAGGVTEAYRRLGRFADARDLDQDVLDRRRRLLGDDHRESLRVAAHLADDLYGLGEADRARALDEEVLARHRRVFGEGHPGSLASALRLARDLTALGDLGRATELRAWARSRQPGGTPGRQPGGTPRHRSGGESGVDIPDLSGR